MSSLPSSSDAAYSAVIIGEEGWKTYETMKDGEKKKKLSPNEFNLIISKQNWWQRWSRNLFVVKVLSQLKKIQKKIKYGINQK